MGIETIILGVLTGAFIVASGTVGIISAVNAEKRNSDYYRKLNKMLDSSPTYSSGPLATQNNNCLTIPIIYGEVKVAGNTIWQDDSETSEIKRIISFATGEVEDIFDIKINNENPSEFLNCTYSIYKGTMTQQIDSRIPGNTMEEKAELTGGLKGIAYVAVSATATSQLTNLFNLTAKIKGQKVKVYSDTKNFTVKYTNNPAWCLLDFLTNYNACAININELDIQSFIEAAQYCDKEIDGKPRFTLNLILDERRSRLEWIDSILMTCHGFISYQNGKLSMHIEKEEDTMQVFTPENIIAGSERFWTTPREKRADIFKVQYIDPENEYAKIFATAEAEVFENEQPIVQEAKIYGVTNFEQASRLAWYYLNQAKTCNKFIAFATSQEGLDRTVGDVIEITSTFLGYKNKKMRIINMAEAQAGQIYITCKEYNPDLYCDKKGSAKPIVNAINLPNLFTTPPTPAHLVLNEYGWRTPEGNHIANIQVKYDAVDFVHFKHYEISYSCDNGTTWEQGNISYDNSYTIGNVQIGKEYIVRVQSVSNQYVFSKAAEALISIIGKNNPPQNVKEFNIFQKNDILKVVIIPPNEPDIEKYEIRKGLTWENAETITIFSGTSTSFKPDTNGTLSYLIKAIDNVGNYSESPVRTAVNVYGLTPQNIVIDKAFVKSDFTDQNSYKILPVIDLGINFEDYRLARETDLTVEVENYDSILIEYRCGYSAFEGWNYLIFDNNVWEDNAEVNWSEWKSLRAFPTFSGQYLQVRISSKEVGFDINTLERIRVIADVDDIEDILTNIDILAEKTTISFNKRFQDIPVITPITTDLTGKICSWRISNVQRNKFDIELIDNDDKLIAGKILNATIRGY